MNWIKIIIAAIVLESACATDFLGQGKNATRIKWGVGRYTSSFGLTARPFGAQPVVFYISYY